METVFVKTGNRSNFDFAAKIFKGKKVLNGFNKLSESVIFESVASDEFEVQDLLFPNEIEAYLYIDYPLCTVVKETIKFKTLHELITAIRQTYQTIYKEEEASPGKYGIWGHSIYDLDIEAIRILEGKDKPLVEVAIGS